MKRIAALLALCVVGASAAPAAFDATERQLRSAIDKASEKGRLDEVRALRLELAREATQNGYYFDAERQYELLLAARPGKKARVNLFTELGRLRESTGDDPSAVSAFEDARHDDPRAWTATLHLAQADTRLGLYKDAEAMYLKCLELRPGDLEARDGLGDMYRARGFLEQAMAIYQETIKRRPTAASFSGLADCYIRRNDIARAIATLQKAKASGVPGDYDTPLGFAYRRAGNFAQAAAVWEKVLADHPDRSDLKLNLVWAYIPLGRLRAADRLIEGLLTAYPRSPLVHFTAAWLKLRQGDVAAARRESARVDDLSPTDLVKHYNERLTQGIQQ